MVLLIAHKCNSPPMYVLLHPTVPAIKEKGSWSRRFEISKDLFAMHLLL